MDVGIKTIMKNLYLFGGGGHAFASGVRMRGPIEKAEEKILSALSDKIKESLD